MSRLWTLSLLAFSVTAFAAEPTYPPTPTTSTPSSADTPDPMKPGARFTDGELVQILQNLNNTAIESGRLALTKVKNASLRDYAQTMVDEHTANQQDLQRIMGNAGISSSAGKEAADTQKKFDKMLTDLRTKEAKDFDKAYADAQIQMHQDALDIIDDKLLENVSNPELRTHFQATRNRVSGHLERAKAIKKQIVG